jgi:hypothetical protein
VESDDLLTRKEAAALLKVRPKLLTEWKRAGKGPPSITFNRRVTRYLRADLERYIEEHRVQPKGRANGEGLAVEQDFRS